MRTIKFRYWNKIDKIMSIDASIQFIKSYCNNLNDFFIHNAIKNGLVVMQFTGLLDKNGKEIYEGDIIKTNNWITVVKFKKGKFLVFDGLDTELATGSIDSETDEVVGNIYENPELLK